jgi:hypothetical protein
MSSALLANTALTAEFDAGTTALGHNWNLLDGDGNVVGKTRRAYSGGIVGRALWRSVTVTGMDSGNDIKCEVLDADDSVVAKLFSRVQKDGRWVEVSGAGDEAIGTVRRDKEAGFSYEDASGTEIARVPVLDVKADGWELLDASGTRIGALTREPAKRVDGPSLTDYALGLNTYTDNARDFQATMHLGFAFSNTYGITLAELPAAEPLRTLAVLTPVIAGYSY